MRNLEKILTRSTRIHHGKISTTRCGIIHLARCCCSELGAFRAQNPCATLPTDGERCRSLPIRIAHGSQKISRHRWSFARCIHSEPSSWRQGRNRNVHPIAYANYKARSAQHHRHHLRRSRLWRPWMLRIEAGHAQYRSSRRPGCALYPSLHAHRAVLGLARGLDDRSIPHPCRRNRRLRSAQRHRYVP